MKLVRKFRKKLESVWGKITIGIFGKFSKKKCVLNREVLCFGYFKRACTKDILKKI